MEGFFTTCIDSQLSFNYRGSNRKQKRKKKDYILCILPCLDNNNQLRMSLANECLNSIGYKFIKENVCIKKWSC